MTAWVEALEVCRQHDPDYPFAPLLRSLIEEMQTDPICVDRGRVIYGNRRKIALEALNMPIRTITLHENSRRALWNNALFGIRS